MAITRLHGEYTSSLAILFWLAVASHVATLQVAATVQVINGPQQELPAARTKLTTLELKFQSELDNSTIIKQLGQQQVFKCQVRLAPIGDRGSQQSRARLKSSLRLLAKEDTADEPTYANPNSSIWDGAAIAPSLAPLKFNVGQLTIEWLKNGRPLAESYSSTINGGDEISVVNVTLRTQHQQRAFDKILGGLARKPRVEIKNTLNGQQLKLTSRLRVSQMRAGDSGQFQCVARASFTVHDDAKLPKSELVEQTLESTSANLIVLPTTFNSNNNSIDTTNSANIATGPTRLAHPNDSAALVKAIKQQGQQQGRHSNNPSLQSDDETEPRPFRYDPRPSRGPTSTSSLFEDDEDLFRLDSSELISAGASELATNDNEQEQQIIGSDTTNNDDLNGLLVGGQLGGRKKSEQHAEAHLDWILDGDGGASDNDEQSGPLSPLPSSSSTSQTLSRRRTQPASGYHKIDDQQQQQQQQEGGGGGGASLVSGEPNGDSTLPLGRSHSGANEEPAASLNHRRLAELGAKDISSSRGQWASGNGNKYAQTSAGGGGDAPDSKLAKLVRKIVLPESSCYTGAGELYRGNAAHSADQRACLNWLQVRASLAGRAWDAAASRLKLSQQQQQQQQQSQKRENQTTTITTTTNYLSGSSLSTVSATIDDHNYCRNPNGDPRGPWCFVAYSEPLDGVILTSARPLSSSSSQKKLITHRQQVVRVGARLSSEGVSASASTQPLLVVVSPCAQIVSCSQYLWLYVVAPPLGLLVLLTCIASLAIRSVRKSRCNAIFSSTAYQRQPLKCGGASSPGSAGALSLGLGKLFASRRPSRKRLVSTEERKPTALCCGLGKKSTKGQRHAAATRTTTSYLDDDIFEIVDDIDWSDGQTAAGVGSQAASVSPKSSESFNLHSTASESSRQSSTSPRRTVRTNTNEMLLGDWCARKPCRAALAASKSTNPMFSEQALDLQLSQRQQQQQQQIGVDSRHSGGQMNKMSKSRSQAGPMFATLRCHVRNTHQKRLAADSSSGSGGRRAELSQLQPQAKKSSSFIEHHHQYSNGEMHQSKQRTGNCDWAQPTAAAAAAAAAVGNSLSIHSDLSSTTRTGHLISCASSSCGSSGSNNALAGNNNNNNHDTPPVTGDSERLTLASELPRLDASSVTLAYETEAIYEGKFSQVLKAYHKQNELDLTQATGRIGAQVAVCSLKQQAAIDESVFYASELRLNNLNHLNILKLMGYVQSSKLADAIGDGNSQTSSAGSDLLETTSGVGRVRCSLVYDMAHLIDLSDWLKEQCKDAIVAQDDEISGDLSLRQNLTCIAKQTALALDYLHDKNIVYKDLACRNCFLDVTRMLVKLASFNVEPEFVSHEESSAYGHSGVPGPNSNDNRIQSNGDDNNQQELLSKKLSLKSMVRPKYLLDYYVIDSRPSECQLLPLSWIPLESILFNKFNKQTDIWSFGCLLYELFSLGEVAYFGYSSKQVIDSVRSNMMPPQPLLCPNGIYKLMCKCLSDIPTLRPNIKHVYEQLNLYSGQCSSFLNHHLCMI